MSHTQPNNSDHKECDHCRDLTQVDMRDFAREIAQDVSGGDLMLLRGDLGAGKTTFSQLILEELGAVGPFTSPTFVIMKEYELGGVNQSTEFSDDGIVKVFHIDAYRIEANDMLELGWKDLVSQTNALIIVEWPERIQELLQNMDDRIWNLEFNHDTEQSRRVCVCSKPSRVKKISKNI